MFVGWFASFVCVCVNGCLFVLAEIKGLGFNELSGCDAGCCWRFMGSGTNYC